MDELWELLIRDFLSSCESTLNDNSPVCGMYDNYTGLLYYRRLVCAVYI